MTPGKLTLDPMTEGDGWSGIPAIKITVGPEAGPFAAPASPIESAELLFERNDSALPNPVIDLSTANSKLTVTNAAEWELSVPEQLVPDLKEGEWIFQLKITPVGGLPLTYISDVLKVLRTVKKIS